MADDLSRRRFLGGATAASGLSALACAGGAPGPSGEGEGAPRRPNVVFMISDDHRWDLMSHVGHPLLETPHMDRIAAEGARFPNAFVACSLCSPTRSSFLSGLYAHQHGVLSNEAIRIRRFYNQVPIFPKALQGSGYHTAWIGKLHIGRDAEPREGFDHWAVLPWQGLYENPRYNFNGEERYVEGWVDDLTGDFASEWLADAPEPFCLCLGFKAPHADQTPPPRYRSLYDDVDVPRPQTYAEDYAATGKPNVVSQSGTRIETFFDGVQRKGGDWQRWIKDVYRCVKAVDDNIGKVLAALDARGIAKDTIVVYVGDNGLFLGEHGLADKRFAYEEALRVPFLIRYPRKIAPGTAPEAMALNIDLSPTLLGYCGVTPPEATEGEDLAPILADPKLPGRDSFVYEYDDPGFVSEKQGFAFPHVLALRTRRHKLIHYMQSVADTDELYDLALDPAEIQNRIDDPDSAEVRASMEAALAAWQRETGWRPPIPVLAWAWSGPLQVRPEAAPNNRLPEGVAVQWSTIRGPEGRAVRLGQAPEGSVSYLRLQLECDEPSCGAAMFLGLNVRFIAALNGKRIATREAPRRFVARQFAFDLPLKAGGNTLLLRLTHGARPVGVLASVQTVGWRGASGQVVRVRG